LYSESIFSYIVSISVLLQVILLPIIGSVADLKNSRHKLLYAFAYVGAIFTILLYLLNEQTIFIGCLIFILANVFYGASIVMYNSLLIDIAEENERDRVSSMGWAIGYIGGGILLGINLLTIFFHNELGFQFEEAVRVSILSAGVWWLLFSIISQSNLNLSKPKVNLTTEQSIKKSSGKLKATFRNVLKNRNALLFFLAYLFFNDGVQTVIIISTQFGKRELNLGMEFIVLVLLGVQFLSFLGTIIIMKLDEYLKAKKTLILCLSIWSFIVIYSFFFLKDEIGFVVLAILISLVLGGTQALSRAMFSFFIPENSQAEYYSFYEITEKGSSWFGPLVFGLVLQFTKSYRLAILSLILFFLLGILLLLKVEISRVETGVSK
jgi:UMF1 family MFS transporter